MRRKTTLRRLEAQIRALQARAEAIRKAEKPGIRELRALLKKHKLGLQEVKQAFAWPVRTSKLRGKRLKPKYRNPDDTSQTWAGRGRQPAWVRNALRKGKTLEQLAI